MVGEEVEEETEQGREKEGIRLGKWWVRTWKKRENKGEGRRRIRKKRRWRKRRDKEKRKVKE